MVENIGWGIQFKTLSVWSTLTRTGPIRELSQDIGLNENSVMRLASLDGFMIISWSGFELSLPVFVASSLSLQLLGYIKSSIFTGFTVTNDISASFCER